MARMETNVIYQAEPDYIISPYQRPPTPTKPASSSCSVWAKVAVAVTAVAAVGAVIAIAVVFTRSNSDSCDGFKCTSGPVSSGGSDCILSSSKCDGVQDCKDNEDEESCTQESSGCSDGQFTCVHGGSNGNCISSSLTCDGKNDCNNGTDELNCNGTASCDREESMKSIATNCEADIGKCSVSVCTEGASSKCCTPTYERTTAKCSGTDVEYSRITGCSCEACESAKVYVTGSLDSCDPSTQDCSLSIQLDGEEITTANSNGQFSFSAEFPTNNRLTFTVVDPSKTFQTQVKTIELTPNQTAYSTSVKLTLKPESVKFESNTEKSMELGTTKSVAIVFAPNSFTLPDGKPYNGEVTSTLQFIDPTSEEDVDGIPATLQVFNDNGEEGMLSSLGMFVLSLETEDGTSLTSTGVNLNVQISTAIDETEIENQEVWLLDSSKGIWTSVGSMAPTDESSAKRRKRDNHRSASATVDLGGAEIIMNLDRVIWRYCHMKVRLFDDTQTEIPNVDVVSLYSRSADGSWANFIRRPTGSDGICVSVPCDAKSFDIVKVQVDQTGTVVDEPKMTESLKTLYGFTVDGSAFSVKIPSEGAIFDGEGPMYDNFFKCLTAPTSDNYFSFSGKSTTIETNTIDFNEDQPFNPWISDVFAWWPNRNNFKACYVKVYILPSYIDEEASWDLLNGWTVEAVSRGGNHSDTQGKEYGKRIELVGTSLETCVEYKCPNILSDGKFDWTEVTITPRKDGIVFALVAPMEFDITNFPEYATIAEYQDIPNQIGADSLTGRAPLTHLSEFGIYTAEQSHPKFAKKEAKAACNSGGSVLTFIAGSAPANIEVNTVPIDENNPNENWEDNHLSWWPNPDMFKSCFGKVTIEPMGLNATTLTNWTLEATSLGGTHNSTIGKEYGRRTVSGIDGLTACVEFKTPGLLFDGVEDRTEVIFTPRKEGIEFLLGIPIVDLSTLPTDLTVLFEQETTNLINQLGGQSLRGVLPPTTYSELGMYCVENPVLRLGKLQAHHECIQGQTAVLTFIAKPSSQEGAEDIEENSVAINEDSIFLPWNDDPLSWWPNPALFKACYAKVTLTPMGITENNLQGWKVETINYVGAELDNKGSEYGKRSTIGDGLTACVEYKSPGTLASGDADRTQVRVTPSLENILFSLAVPMVATIDTSSLVTGEELTALQNQLGGTSLIGLLPTDEIPELGMYCVESVHPKLAKLNAKQSCLDGDASALNFIASTPLTPDTEENTVAVDENSPLIPWVDDPLSWYSNAGLFKTCFVKTTFLTTYISKDLLEGSTFTAVSAVGTLDTSGSVYGQRTAEVQDLTVCVEYKCPYTLSTGESDRTAVTLTPSKSGIVFALVIPSTADASLLTHVSAEEQAELVAQLGGASLSATVPSDIVPELGIYYSESLHPRLSKLQARFNCITGTTSVLTFAAAVERQDDEETDSVTSNVPSTETWWPSATFFQACYVKVNFELDGITKESLAGLKVATVSSGGTRTSNIGVEYGSRKTIADTDNLIACVEYKCPDTLTADNPDVTQVTLTPELSGINFALKFTNTDSLDDAIINQYEPIVESQVGGSSLTAPAPTAQDVTGIYFSGTLTPKLAKFEAREKCFLEESSAVITFVASSAG